MDYVKHLGALTLDHRLKRMMQRLLDEAEAIYRALELPIKPRWVSSLLLLHEHGPLTVMEVAERLSITHPAVIQLGQDMIEAGLVEASRDGTDARRRLLGLTPRAEAMLLELQRVWDELTRAQVAAFRTAGCDIIAVLGSVEDRLDRTPLATVVLKRLAGAKGRPKTAPDRRPTTASNPRERKAIQ